MIKQSLQLDILKRFMSTEEVMSLMEKYNQAKKAVGKSGTPRPTTPLDIKIASEFKNGASLKDLAKTYGVSLSKILYSIAWGNK